MKYRVVARDSEGEVEAYLIRKSEDGGSEWNAQPQHMRNVAVIFESREAAALMAQRVGYWDLTVGIEPDEPRTM